MTKKKYAPYVTKDGLDVQKLSLPHRIQLLMTGGIDRIDPSNGEKRNVWREGFVDPVLYLGKTSLSIAKPVLEAIIDGQIQQQKYNGAVLKSQKAIADGLVVGTKDWVESNTYNTKLSSELGRSVTVKEANEILANKKEKTRINKAKQDIINAQEIRKIKKENPVKVEDDLKVSQASKLSISNYGK
tara:strand:- start:315 stop:872 length:558 start_codon:yes stop_codon:yes gene_type:complete